MTEEAVTSPYSVDVLMQQARQLAANYRHATGKSLAGVSGELAVYDAVRLLKLIPTSENPAYEAIGSDDSGDLKGDKIQIKGRVIFSDTKSNERIGQIKLEQQWDSVVLVLYDENYEPFEVYEIDKETLLENIAEKSSKRAKRGAMTVARFRKIATLAWSKEWTA